MLAGPPAPPHRRSKRDAGSATTALDDRRNRATTVSPERSVKFTKNRSLPTCGAKRESEQPALSTRQRCRPTDRGSRPAARRRCARHECGRSAGPRTGCRGRPDPERTRQDSVNPEACVRVRSWAWTSATSRQTRNADTAATGCACAYRNARGRAGEYDPVEGESRASLQPPPASARTSCPPSSAPDEMVPLLLLAIVTIACGRNTPEPPDRDAWSARDCDRHRASWLDAAGR